MGLSCDAEAGACVGVCAREELGEGALGCDYYPTITQQDDDHDSAPHLFAVAVANPGEEPAQVVATRGEDTIDERVVAPGAVELIALPWLPALTNGSGPTKLVVDGAYRLRSDQPVHASQYNPLDATFTNDASLLLPVNAWGERIVVAAWRHYGGFWNFPSLYAVVASEDQTTLSLSSAGSGATVQAGSGVGESGDAELLLDRGDVLQVLSATGDLSGTLVEADKPVQVIGGHECGRVPNDIAACDHLEESVYPTRALGSSYLVAPPAQLPDEDAAKAIYVRVLATQPDTLVSFTPSIAPNTLLLQVGDMLELPLNLESFRVDASEDVLVALYMVGQAAGYGSSDPAMLLAVPIERYKRDYLFYAAPSWARNFADILAPLGASVSVDGLELGPEQWTEIPETGFALARAELLGQGSGAHRINADVEIGVSVYGGSESGSYWYPAGLD